MSDLLIIAGHEFSSRLFLGTAGYPNRKMMLDAVAASGTAMVTASIRRISLAGDDESLIDLLGDRVKFLPNTAGCQTAKDAVLTSELAREALDTNWIKLEVIGDRELLYPDVEELIRATADLVGKGFIVLPYCTEDPVICRKLADAGRTRRRYRHGIRRRACAGARLRGGAGQYRSIEGAKSGADGQKHARRGRSRKAIAARRPHRKEDTRRSIEPAIRAGGHVTD
jgi:hypothetical protein